MRIPINHFRFVMYRIPSQVRGLSTAKFVHAVAHITAIDVVPTVPTWLRPSPHVLPTSMDDHIREQQALVRQRCLYFDLEKKRVEQEIQQCVTSLHTSFLYQIHLGTFPYLVHQMESPGCSFNPMDLITTRTQMDNGQLITYSMKVAAIDRWLQANQNVVAGISVVWDERTMGKERLSVSWWTRHRLHDSDRQKLEQFKHDATTQAAQATQAAHGKIPIIERGIML